MHLLFTAWCSEAAGEHQEHPAQRGDELGAGRQRGRQGQPCRAARAVRAPAAPTVGRHKAGLCLASSHSWSSSPATREGAHSPWSHLGVLAGWTWAAAGTGQGTPRGKGLQRLLVHLGPGNVSSSHVFFQLSFTVNYKLNYFFFLCIFVF